MKKTKKVDIDKMDSIDSFIERMILSKIAYKVLL